MPPSTPLPPGYHLVELLAQRPDVVIARARRGRDDVVLRLEREGLEGQAELAVLATVDHPGLAQLVDYGALPGGGRFVARRWVEGKDLASLAGARDAEALGRIVVHLCAALEYLHAKGFVHGDLKAANVLVRPDDEPVLADFGLARPRSSAAAGAVSGSYYHVAPEVLFGAATDARSDLFALGVLLHQLLAPIRVEPSAFYGLFPARPFLEAARSDPGALPEWARGVVHALVDRDPARRPASASEVARALSGPLGLPTPVAAGERLRWPLQRGREDFLARRLAGLRARRPHAAEWWVAPEAAEARQLAPVVSLRATLEGVPARAIDVGAEIAGLATTRALDEWALGTADGLDAGILVAASSAGERWARRALGCLGRAVEQRRRHGRSLALVVCASRAETSLDATWPVHTWPPVDEASIAEFLTQELETSPERVETLAARLHAECGGSATALQELLDEIASSTWIQPGPERPRLREGALPASLGRRRGGRRERMRADLGGDARSLVAALIVLGGRAPLERAARLARLARAPLGAALDELRAADEVALHHDRDGALALELSGPCEESATLGVPLERWRELHRLAAARLAEEGAERAPVLAHRYLGEGGERVAEDLGAEARLLRERGCAEVALAMLLRVAEGARARGDALEPALAGELALTWATLGDFERAEAVAVTSAEATPRERALHERVRGQIATLRQRHGEALEHYQRALALDAGDRDQVLLAKARSFFESGRYDDLDELARELEARDEPLPRVLDVNVRGFRAMADFRRGAVDRARAELETALATAARLDDPLREAVVRINLGTVERRTGHLRAALEHFLRAEELYERLGFLPGVAQVRSLLGGTRRELGELLAAEPLLASAQQIFERLGDVAGAAAARGVAGLVQLERGRLRAALDELRAAATNLAPAPAAMVLARARECFARIGRAPEGAPSDPELARSDPRIDVAEARVAWLGGDRPGARALARRAHARAEELQLAGPREEAEVLLAALGERLLDSLAPTRSGAGVDTRLLRLLGGLGASTDLEELGRLARELSDRGCEDRAARAWSALARRSQDRATRLDAAARGRSALAACSIGLTPDERSALSRALLGFPDPWPDDLELSPIESEEEWEMDVLSVLDINRRLVEQEDLPTLLGAIVDHALEVTGAERGFLVLEEAGELHLDLALDSRRGDIDEPEVQVSHSILRRVLDAGQALRLSNAADDPDLAAAPSVTALELRSILCQPFDVDDVVRGVIYLDDRMREGAFSERAERLLGLLADQAALAIRQVRRIEEIRRLNVELERQVVTQESDLRAARRALLDAGVTVPVGGLVGDSRPMKRIHELLRRVGPSTLPVLVQGPSGTGKELAARALHDLGPRSEGPFVSENCAALPESLIESELFGFRRGAFTGADRDQEGLFERADGGTLFLDEIGELPLELQAKLLRVLETREIRRLGEAEARPVDFRLVAATNRDLGVEVEEGRFRSDLYYRLDGVRVEMPTLAARPEDIPALVDHFLRLEQAKDRIARVCSPAVLRRLCERAWPGNVRELANEIGRLCVLSSGDLVDSDLVRDPAMAAEQTGFAVDLVPLAELERRAIEQALERTDGDKRRAAELLGISRAKIYQRLKEWREEERA